MSEDVRYGLTPKADHRPSDAFSGNPTERASMLFHFQVDIIWLQAMSNRADLAILAGIWYTTLNLSLLLTKDAIWPRYGLYILLI